MKVCVAGPYSKGDVVINTRQAILDHRTVQFPLVDGAA